MNGVLEAKLFYSLFNFHYVTKCVSNEAVERHFKEALLLIKDDDTKEEGMPGAVVPFDKPIMLSDNLFASEPPIFPILLHDGLVMSAHPDYGLCLVAISTISPGTILMEYVGEWKLLGDSSEETFYECHLERFSNECRFLIRSDASSSSSSSSNCIVQLWKVNGDLKMVVVCNRLIKPGDCLIYACTSYLRRRDGNNDDKNHLASMDPVIWKSLFKWDYIEKSIDHSGGFQQIANELIQQQLGGEMRENCVCKARQFQIDGQSYFGKCFDDQCKLRKKFQECAKSCGEDCFNHPFMKNQMAIHKVAAFPTKRNTIGIKSKCRIPKGSFIGEFIGEIIDYSGSNDKENYRKYCLKIPGSSLGITSLRCGNWTKLINQGSDPNLDCRLYYTSTQKIRFVFIANRQIYADEELVCSFHKMNKINQQKKEEMTDEAMMTDLCIMFAAKLKIFDGPSSEADVEVMMSTLNVTRRRLTRRQNDGCSTTSQLEFGRIYCCTKDGCKQTFPDAWKLKRHISTHDEEVSKFTCKTCLMGFANRSDFMKHNMMHRSEKLKLD